MKDYLISFLDTFDYPKDAYPALTEALEKILASERAGDFLAFLDAYDKGTDIPYFDIFNQMKEVSASAGVHEYTGVFVLLALMTKKAREHWHEKGYDDALFHNTFLDLKYKIVECKLVKGVWGTFVPRWYPGFYKAQMFAFGRLQFEVKPLKKCAKVGTLELTEETPVVSIHIPRTGEGMTPQSIDDAFRAARAFFAEEFRKNNNPLLFHCQSWLLFPEHEHMLKETSNILAFSRRFERIDCGYNKGYGELWRYFDMDYTGDVDALPTTNSLYRAYVDRVRRGLPIGWGEGIILM